ncbi:MAG: DUF501 domain-containing protein [Gaiellales bacterium]
MDDESFVAWQLGRPPRAFKRVAVRCPHGFPAVTEQHARTAGGSPFPTTYYLTCPWLVAALSRVEAAGGVARWQETAAASPTLRQSLAGGQDEQRRIRPQLDVGIGGTADPTMLKCLHAHAAFALARPVYALGEAVLAELDERWCPDARCCEGLESGA